MKARLFFYVSFLLLAACAKGQGISLAPYQDKGASPQNFRVCHGFSCSARTEVHFTDKQWNDIIAVFKEPSKTAAEEREKISRAVALIEKQVTASTGMKPDLGEARTFEADQHQMDCIDEAINTSLYLRFLGDAGVYKWHKAAEPIHRGYFVDGMWPHNSGAVREIETGEIYAIDSYYFNNGIDAAVVPIDVWLDEWRPESLEK